MLPQGLPDGSAVDPRISPPPPIIVVYKRTGDDPLAGRGTSPNQLSLCVYASGLLSPCVYASELKPSKDIHPRRRPGAHSISGVFRTYSKDAHPSTLVCIPALGEAMRSPKLKAKQKSAKSEHKALVNQAMASSVPAMKPSSKWKMQMPDARVHSVPALARTWGTTRCNTRLNDMGPGGSAGRLGCIRSCLSQSASARPRRNSRPPTGRGPA